MRQFLTVLLLGLLLFVGYQWWSRQRVEPPPIPIAAGDAKPSSQPAPAAVAPPSQPPPSDLGQIRMAATDQLPAGFAQAALLNEIRQALEQGNAAEAQARLLALPKEALTDPVVKKFTAVLWNNLGVLQAGKSGGAAGVAALKTAVSLDPADPRAHVNLTHAMWESKDPGLNKELLEKTIGLAPEEPLPHLALAEMLIKSNDLAGARAHLEQAKDRGAEAPNLRAYQAQLSAQVEQTQKAEQKFLARESSHFQVKFDGNEDDVVWKRVAEILEDAYREIGQQLGHYPSQPILVVLHTRETFHSATGGPAWSDGLYDPTMGRIKVPTQGALTDQARLTQVLRHEYVHALLHDRMGGRRVIPQWLNEGLAMQLAGDPRPDIPELVHGQVSLYTLTSLEGNWMGLTPKQANLAYLEGNSATKYFIDRYGMEKVREVLGQLANGQPIAAAMQDRLFITYDQFQQRWLDELNEKIKAGRS